MLTSVRVLPVAGSRAKSQRSLLSAERAPITALIPSSLQTGALSWMSRSVETGVRAGAVWGAGGGGAVSVRAGAGAGGGHPFLAVIHPFHLAGLHVEDGEARSALGVADIGAAGEVFGVSAVADEVGNDGAFGGRGGRFEDARDDVLFVGRELQSAGGLARLQGEGLACGGGLQCALLLFFALFDALADHLQEFLLFLLEVFLAIAAAHFGGRIGGGAASAAALPAATAEAAK